MKKTIDPGIVLAIKRAIRDGQPKAHIARRYGVSRMTVYRLRDNNKQPTRCRRCGVLLKAQSCMTCQIREAGGATCTITDARL